MKNTYLVSPNDRLAFYNHMKKRNYRDKYFTGDYMINSKFPFAIYPSKKEITTMESITVCACAASAHQILSFEDFKEIMKKF